MKFGTTGSKINYAWAPSHNFVGLYRRNEGTYRQSEKNLLNSNNSPRPYNIVNFGLLAAFVSLGHRS